MAADLLPVNLAVVDGFEWCTMHDDIADEASDDLPAAQRHSTVASQRNAGTHCHLVRLLRQPAPTEPAGRTPTPSLRQQHTHDRHSCTSAVRDASNGSTSTRTSPPHATRGLTIPELVEQYRNETRSRVLRHQPSSPLALRHCGRMKLYIASKSEHGPTWQIAYWLSDEDEDRQYVEGQDLDAWISSGPAGSDDWADWSLCFIERCPDAAKAYLELHRGGV